mmetsp:Transcript_90780/g.234410  ORF Transcript_90780/g.234410 Transcript_90780/m.234410 type:complete len:330 (-) Transcript_90780:179-1168(-)
MSDSANFSSMFNLGRSFFRRAIEHHACKRETGTDQKTTPRSKEISTKNCRTSCCDCGRAAFRHTMSRGSGAGCASSSEPLTASSSSTTWHAMHAACSVRKVTNADVEEAVCPRIMDAGARKLGVRSASPPNGVLMPEGGAGVPRADSGTSCRTRRKEVPTTSVATELSEPTAAAIALFAVRRLSVAATHNSAMAEYLAFSGEVCVTKVRGCSDEPLEAQLRPCAMVALEALLWRMPCRSSPYGISTTSDWRRTRGHRSSRSSISSSSSDSESVETSLGVRLGSWAASSASSTRSPMLSRKSNRTAWYSCTVLLSGSSCSILSANLRASS